MRDTMKFVTVRDLRGRSAEIWRELAIEHEMVVTSNGKPIAILTSTSEETFEQTTGVPHAMASITGSPNPSYRDG